MSFTIEVTQEGEVTFQDPTATSGKDPVSDQPSGIQVYNSILMYDSLHNRHPHINAVYSGKIYPRKDVNFLLDSGSPRNVVAQGLIGNNDIRGRTFIIEGIGGGRIRTLGYVSLIVELTLGGTTKTKRLEFAVVPELVDYQIIGLSGLEEFKVQSKHEDGVSAFSFIEDQQESFTIRDVMDAAATVIEGESIEELRRALLEMHDARHMQQNS